MGYAIKQLCALWLDDYRVLISYANFKRDLIGKTIDKNAKITL